MNIKFYISCIFYFLSFTISNAQKTIPVVHNYNGLEIGFGQTKIIIKTDPLTRLPIGNIPFDKVFILRVYFGKNVANDQNLIPLYLHDKKTGNNIYQKLDYLDLNSIDAAKYDKSDEMLNTFPNAIDIVMPALYPNHDYEIIYVTALSLEVLNHYLDVFNLFYTGKIAEGKKLQSDYKTQLNDSGVPAEGYVYQYYNDNKLKSIYDKYPVNTSAANKEITDFMKNNNYLNAKIGLILDFFSSAASYSNLSIFGTYTYTIQSSSKLRIVADAGVIYAGWQPGFNVVTSYVGLNISLRPFDPDIPFRTLVKYDRIKFYQRFTLNLGITLNSIAKDNYRANLFSNNNIIVGLGYKVSHVINLNFGGLLYENIDPNPLITKNTLGVAPYAGISINLLIKEAIGDIAKVFTYGK